MKRLLPFVALAVLVYSRALAQDRSKRLRTQIDAKTKAASK